MNKRALNNECLTAMNNTMMLKGKSFKLLISLSVLLDVLLD